MNVGLWTSDLTAIAMPQVSPMRLLPIPQPFGKRHPDPSASLRSLHMWPYRRRKTLEMESGTLRAITKHADARETKTRSAAHHAGRQTRSPAALRPRHDDPRRLQGDAGVESHARSSLQTVRASIPHVRAGFRRSRPEWATIAHTVRTLSRQVCYLIDFRRTSQKAQRLKRPISSSPPQS
jgi:hypothetical protein